MATTPVEIPKKYESNPFMLSFQALSRFFDANSVWAVVIIVFNLIGFFFQGVSNLASISTPESTPTNVASESAINSPEPAVIVAIVVLVLIFVIVAIVVGTVINVFLQGMFSYVALQSEKGKKVSFSEAFNAVTKRFWVLLGAQLLAMLKILGWTLLLIIPGIIAAMRYALLPYIIMAEDSIDGAGSSHTRVKAVTKGRLWEVFGVSTVAAIVPVLGPALDISGKAALYNQLSHYHDNNLEKPKIHWLNYIGILLLGLLAFFVALVALVLVSLSISNRV